MDEKEAVEFIDNQISYGYIDLNRVCDSEEFDLIVKAFEEYKENHGLA